MAKKAESSLDQIVQTKAEELLRNLEIAAAVRVEQDSEGVFKVTIETEDSGLLIGYHGETLSSFQMILGLLIYRATKEWHRVLVEVGDYRARREEQLRAMAEAYARQALSGGQPIYLPYMSPVERRVIHMALQDHPQVMTVSEGEGRHRRLVVKAREQ